ncbi:helix-turn-helix transcriptional regulator [Amycolatopsis antarctica]|uniref:Helix-turn-helix transcriptional regulator n=1 Tax=Amycolatopsis antarctica TaxID=1854586 RepID=A0A263D2T3_9PSEU|nr:response regulator transcription factor [Amycolatopsis antarctica]OZM72773.1 helix-turn-helix transcriptional regulator [Amycolatopsis antarctica]
MTRSTGSNRLQPGPRVAGNRTLGVAAVDPVPIFRDGLAAMVQRAPGLHWVGQAANQHAILQLSEQLRPDVVLLDSGLDPQGHLVRLLSTGDRNVVIVMLVRHAHRTPQYLAGLVEAGAHGIVPRAAEARRLSEAIHRTHADRHYVDPTLAALTVKPKRAQNGDSGMRVQMPLSRREYQVLQLLAEGLENAAIARMLFLSVETVRTHVKSILRKLSARDRTHAVTTAFRTGILVIQPDDPRTDTAPAPRR